MTEYIKDILKKWWATRCWHQWDWDRGLIRKGSLGIDYEFLVRKCVKCNTEIGAKYPLGTWEKVKSLCGKIKRINL